MCLCSKISFYSHLDAQYTNSNSLTSPCLRTLCVSHMLVKVLGGNDSPGASEQWAKGHQQGRYIW